ncbi:MAG: hypothetical protein H8E31_10240, partial [Planctomycetes bacterium]|nr:hypothetical protein [Planctomycetota bacterium]
MQGNSTALDSSAVAAWVDPAWAADIPPALVEDIKVPAKPPPFGKDWKQHGHLDPVFAQAEALCRRRALPRPPG